MLKQKLSRMAEAIPEMAADQRRIGVMAGAAGSETMARHCGETTADQALRKAAGRVSNRAQKSSDRPEK